MPNLNILETFKTKEELINYFDEIGQIITEEEIENLKKSYTETENAEGALSLQQLDDVAGGGVFAFVEDSVDERGNVAYRVKAAVVQGSEGFLNIMNKEKFILFSSTITYACAKNVSCDDATPCNDRCSNCPEPHDLDRPTVEQIYPGIFANNEVYETIISSDINECLRYNFIMEGNGTVKLLDKGATTLEQFMNDGRTISEFFPNLSNLSMDNLSEIERAQFQAFIIRTNPETVEINYGHPFDIDPSFWMDAMPGILPSLPSELYKSHSDRDPFEEDDPFMSD